MFLLPTKVFPPTATALRDALEESLRGVITPAQQIVTVEDKQYPELAAIRVSLNQANITNRPLRPAPPVGPIEDGWQVANLEIMGQPLLVEQAQVGLYCTAREVRLGCGRDQDGNVLLVLQDAVDGTVEIAVALAELEKLVVAGATKAAAPQGVNVERARIELRARSERALDVVARVRAKKLFLTAEVTISGSVAIDEQLNARLSDLRCGGEGTLGTLACGFIGPYLTRFEGRSFSLLALSLGEVKLRDIRIAAGQELRVTARFGRVA